MKNRMINFLSLCCAVIVLLGSLPLLAQTVHNCDNKISAAYLHLVPPASMTIEGLKTLAYNARHKRGALGTTQQLVCDRQKKTGVAIYPMPKPEESNWFTNELQSQVTVNLVLPRGIR